MLSMHSDEPIFYMYEDKDGWKKTDKHTTEEINRSIRSGIPFDTAGRVLFPQWAKPKNPRKTVVAWLVTKEGYRAVRYFWRIQEHSRACGRCKMVDDTTCAHQVPYTLKYDPNTAFWTLANGADAASPKLHKILDASNY